MSLYWQSNYATMKANSMRWLLISQSLVLFGSSMVFPYYVIFMKNVGASFFQFGLAYALFSLSSALIHVFTGRLLERFGGNILLAVSSWGMAVSLLFFPAVTAISQLYILQVIMGILNALQKTSEKTMIADVTDSSSRGRQIGRYHAWTTLYSSLAVIIAGYAIDLFTLSIIFYAGSLFMFISGFASLRINGKETA